MKPRRNKTPWRRNSRDEIYKEFAIAIHPVGDGGITIRLNGSIMYHVREYHFQVVVESAHL